ncbi:pancreatic lipase-related protein 2 [Aplysia californica]|uniref:Pancreatic lipase-related protein 2 n=1 Tax=Aplysia californica TaxID=6500 RepID=A0ABM0K711_APLCA|nr:pancreatic lipase-related protein 2 [Aplysia californica]
MLYTKESPNSAVLLDARHTDTVGTKWPLFKKRPTKIIIHGFVDDPAKELWMKTMKTEFLKHHDFNIIIVDWHHGNQMPYTQATANTRLVGAQVALLIKQLKVR